MHLRMLGRNCSKMNRMVVMVVAEWAKITSLFCLEKVLCPKQFDASGMVTLPFVGPAQVIASAGCKTSCHHAKHSFINVHISTMLVHSNLLLDNY